MGWDQDYCVPSYMELLIKLTGKRPEELLESYLLTQHLSVVKKEDVVLDEGFFHDIIGIKVTLSDGRVFVPKLKERFTENGNHGIDTYEYCLENEDPEVIQINADTTDPDIDVFEVPREYGGEDADLNLSDFRDESY
jgi:hypothetical protein